ncbi:hypothetical protein N5W20_06845 [Candidatus Kirkpatrickella diaphorinae]|uniref:Phage neck terminator protein gp12-like domain-containing protein n=1 Tax=Candidatus Kirkpatrickella diaphorinae TaxID=2984322 RepID=A0ABY6GH37_9PROT|nr:hypothetical protein [Candidatus Kirkpatrickella diaphorinae]UYH50822.1 hypothetical protein N5W20_06845 [Candidatus Kirkpatrickella diaphorinae]
MEQSLPKPDVSTALTLLRRWLLTLLPEGTVIMRAHQNDVPVPTRLYVLMRPILTTWLSRPWRGFSENAVTTYTILRLDVELTIAGDDAEAISHWIALHFNDPSVISWFHAQDNQVTPLEASSPVSDVARDDARGYVLGWKWELAFQLNQTMSARIEMAESAAIQAAPTHRAE